MAYTKEDEIKLELENLYKRCVQLLTIRWQAVGIAIALISGFWIFAMREMVTNNQKPGVIYLLIFLGVFFSIIILFVWRYITHLLGDEEAQYWDSVFICNKLLKENEVSKLTDEEIRVKQDEIRETDLKIYNLMQYLSNEFDDFWDNKFRLNNLFFLLFKDEKLKLSNENIYQKKFEKGQWKFDWWIFCLIVILWIFGWAAFYEIFLLDSENNFYILFRSLILWIFIVYAIFLLPIIFYFLEYLIPNFKKRGSSCRLVVIENKIYKISSKEKLDKREQEKKARKHL